MTDVQNIRWNRISIEAAAIVSSILLAFTIDAWWDQNKEASRAEELLTALEIEWVIELGRIDERLSAYRDVRKSMIQIMDAHTDSNNITGDAARALWENVSNWSTYKPSVAAYQVLLAYGLDQIDDPATRLAVAEWPTVLAEITPEQEAIHQLALLDLRAELARVSHNLERPWYDEGSQSNARNLGIEPGEMALATIKDHSVMTVQRHIMILLNQYAGQLKHVRTTLDENIQTLKNR